MKVIGYKIYFWANELGEPIHIHVSKRNPTMNSTKIWLTKAGSCILANNKSKIPQNDLNNYWTLLQNIISSLFQNGKSTITLMI